MKKKSTRRFVPGLRDMCSKIQAEKNSWRRYVRCMREKNGYSRRSGHWYRNEPSGPNVTDPGFSNVLGLFGIQKPPSATNRYPGGGQVGAVLLNPKWIKAGSINTTGEYNHYSALRSYEDLLGLTRGGDDGFGHLGYAGQVGLQPFGRDVFNARAGGGDH